jgi:hypothetical protein
LIGGVGVPIHDGMSLYSAIRSESIWLASCTMAGLMTRSESSPIFRVRSCDVNLKSTPLRLLTVMLVEPSTTSWVAMTAPSRTVKSVGLRMVMVSPTL